ncbi:type I-E CRISPR-associated protein Cas6/Cse3/CasE [Myxococcota bacterium]|nr:type I-E CRISPR-associated protein Cas6/Cse3/CasE [Myxococcota bacterium]MBU1429410.1 type I-E CRISPR-associated protein Cas6/Cse3/CasE [Myxococcota bacterium]MBU1900382.1 type I-E CRISPR-associated protein Cas6/Cse3/CasE [Myxococcota bacterium]
MADLHLIQLFFDTARLTAAVNAGRDEDGGYILHRGMAGLFIGGVPAPLWYRERRGLVEVLAYAQEDAAALGERAALTLNPALWHSLMPGSLLSKPMPRFREGQHLGFEVRACPVKRTRPAGEAARERDAFLVACEGGEGGEAPPREQVYLGWLSEQLEGMGARLIESQLVGFQLQRVFRQQRQDGHRSRGRLTRPDALFRGRLMVEEPVQFEAFLSRGVGRHRAFGFGMLRLSPA